MSDLKNSLLVAQQLPEYVRDDYPIFVSFLEAYYEYLETQQGTQKNDLIKQAKDLQYVSDVDDSIDAFSESFLANFASLMPQDVQVDKAFLIKNVLPLYLARGNEKSFALLFRLLYGEEVKLTYPRDNILRASAGEWTVENVLRVSNDVYSTYTADGTTTTFLLAQPSLVSELSVYVDGVLTSSGFVVRKETKKLIFDTAPAEDSIIQVYYTNFDFTLFTSRQITGVSSGATAVVERASPRLVTQQTSIELYIDNYNLNGVFLNAEEITGQIVADDGSLITIGSKTISPVNLITVIDGGASYNVGDIVPITGGGYTTQAEAVVDSVSTGFVDNINVNYGGAGFQAGGIISGDGPGSTIVTAAVVTVDSSGANTANSFTVFTDIITPYANTLISSSDYAFPADVIPTGENASTRLIDAFSRGTITGIGSITSATILFSDASSNSVSFDAEGAKIETLANTFIDIKTFGALGRIRINDGGQGYMKGDEISFGPNPSSTSGIGAAAAVTNVSSNGTITKIEFGPSRVSGTVSITSGGVEVTGTGTNFGSELVVGDHILVNLESRYINSISSATSFNVNVAFTKTSTGAKVGVYDRYLIGGQGYIQNNFPTITVSSANGSATGANVEIVSLMGDSEQVSGTTSGVAGTINKIRITNPGAGYEFLPAVDLTQSGDGSATAQAVIERSYVSFPGKWSSSEGILSSLDRRLEGLDYYIDFTYVTSVATEFSKYKDVIKGLLHPAGFKNYAQYPIDRNMSIDITAGSTKELSISGRVAVTNGSIIVTGSNTRFNVANTSSILTIGSRISVNNEIRTVNNIISNTQITVSSAFTSNATAQTIIIFA